MKTINTGFEEVPLQNLKMHPRNVNQGDFGAIQESIEANGFFGAVTVNKRTGHILAGNHRYKVAKEQHAATIPVIWVDVDEESELRILLADNRTARLGHDDENALAALLSELALSEGGLSGTGFDGDDLDEIIGRMAGGGGGGTELLTDPDEVPENAPTRCNAGDLWQLGRHRLFCGSSVAYDPGSIDTLFFDPPWDEVFEPYAANSTLAFSDGCRFGDITSLLGSPTWVFVWDCVSSWYTPNRPLRRIKLCAWYGDVQHYDFNGAHYGNAGEERTVSNTRGEYLFTPDPRGKHLSDLFSLPITKFHSESEHSHAKPVDWLKMLIANCTQGTVYDPFAGSGSSLIACESIGRDWHGVEISPFYCDVILTRWENATGQTATILEAGNGN